MSKSRKGRSSDASSNLAASTKLCLWCGEPLTGKARKYCQEPRWCRQNAYSAKVRVPVPMVRIKCVVNGRYFLSKNPRAKYCSDRCRGRAATIAGYGITVEEYNTILEAQGKKCYICGKKAKKWHMDHDHQTGQFLGIVCSTCNVHVLPNVRTAEAAERLADYRRMPPAERVLGKQVFVKERKAKATKSSWRTTVYR